MENLQQDDNEKTEKLQMDQLLSKGQETYYFRQKVKEFVQWI